GSEGVEKRGQLRIVLLVSVWAMAAGAVWGLYAGQLLIAAVFGFAAVFDLFFLFFATRSS
ncbi:MAG: hypothetical protein ACREBP_11055, partial [Sphingomicrobium sp.]